MRIRPLVAVSGLAVALSALPFTTWTLTRATVRPVATVTIGHRGADTQAPENTLASIDAAHRLGVDWVENDVQRTRDDRLVVVHDTTLTRTTNARSLYPGRSPWKVADFTLAEVERLDAGSWFGKRFAGERIPTLDTYLRRIDHNRQNLLLEIKNPALYPGVARQIAARLRADGWLDTAHRERRLMVQSFDAGALAAFHRLVPGVRTGFLGGPPAGRLARYAAYVDTINPDASHLTGRYISAVHAVRGDHGKPLRVYPWTVDDTTRAVALSRLGADGVITDRPAAVRAALAADTARRSPGARR